MGLITTRKLILKSFNTYWHPF